MQKGLLVVLSGPSGVGKGTIVAKYLALKPDTKLSISCTTRAPREGEQDGVSYYFTSQEKFKEMIALNEFLEYADVFGKYYGTPKTKVESQLASGSDVMLEIDVKGGHNVKSNAPEAVLIFIAPPSLKELKERLRGRGTETEEQIERRFAGAEAELSHMKEYDYIIVNDDLNQAVEELNAIITAEKIKANRQNVINKFLEV